MKARTLPQGSSLLFYFIYFMQWQTIHLKEVESTNDYAKSNEYPLPTLIYADYQTKGRGQFQNIWHSQAQQNLLCSIVLPIHIQVAHSYYISEWISIVLVELIKHLNTTIHHIQIKWPNDIIVQTNDGFKKIAGILIENSIEENHINKSIIGIGLNVNQTSFEQLEKIATSLKCINQKHYNISHIVSLLINITNHYYPLIELQKFSLIHQQYVHYLYGWQKEFFFKEKDNIMKGKIIAIQSDGKLCIQTDNNIKIYTTKEIQFLL